MHSFLNLFRAFSKKTWLMLGALVVLGGGAATVFALHTSAPAATSATPATTSHVQVSTVASLAAGAVGPLSVTGKVTSLAHASILAQTAGEITALKHSIGDYVAAGGIIAEFNNSAQQAAVTQAQGAYDAAVAVADKAGGSTLANARSGVTAALASAASALDDAIAVRADALFTNPRTDTPKLSITVPDSALIATIESERVSLAASLADAHLQVASSTSVDPDTASAAMQRDLSAALAFLNNLLTAVNETPASQQTTAATLASYQTSLAAARTEIVSAISGVTKAKSAYDSNNVSAAQASVTQAKGALEAAQAALEKTIVRSPISGTIVSLPITQGSYVSMYSPVATVSNPHALYIDIQVTPSDARSLAVGGAALINGSLHGTITFIAPALDPSTGKIEVKVGLSAAASQALVDGEVVSVSLTRSVQQVTRSSGALTLPIVSLKMLPSGPVVFTVSTSSALVAHAVTLGSILGSQVVVRSGVTPSMLIVTDARGLATGQTVIVDSSK